MLPVRKKKKKRKWAQNNQTQFFLGRSCFILHFVIEMCWKTTHQSTRSTTFLHILARKNILLRCVSPNGNWDGVHAELTYWP